MQMAAKPHPRPTNGELEILNVLWERGPSTVREVHEHLGRQIGYTTVLKLLQIMTEKGLVMRDESERSHVYRAKQKQSQVQRRLVRDLLDRAFTGATDQLILQALSARNLKREELAEIRKMLDELERGQR